MRIVKALSAAAGLLAVTLFILLISLDHAEFISLVARATGYTKPDRIASQLTPARFSLLRFAMLGLLAAAALLFARPTLILRPLAKATEAVRAARHALRCVWERMAVWERWMLVVLALFCTALRSHWALHEPSHTDEAVTWLQYASRGPLVALSYYSAPNNHILHSLLVSLFGLLPVDTLTAMRIPVLIEALLAQVLLHLLLRRYLGAWPAMLATVLAVCSYPLLFYGYSSRGYMLVVLAFIGAYGATMSAATHGDRRALTALALASLIGLCTMPSFLYPAALCYGFLLLMGPVRTPGFLKAWLHSGMALAGLTLLFYTPALLLSGPAAILSNPWVAPVSFTEVVHGWLGHFESTFAWISGTSHGFVFALLVVLAGFLGSRGESHVAGKAAAFIVFGSLLIPLVHRVIPFERTWIYLCIALAMSLGLCLQALGRMLPWQLPAGWQALLAFPTVVALIAVQIGSFDQRRERVEYLSHGAARMVDAVLATGRHDVYCEFVVMGDNLTFEMRARGIPLEYTLSAEGVDRDSLLQAGAHEILLVRAAHPISDTRYERIYADSLQHAYQLRE